MVKVSIIVAAYNVEKYIEKCVDSLLAQTLNGIEIIVVDDGSTDNTKKILDNYKDSRLLYYYKTNGGLSDARNFGLSYAKGEFITFVDGDDSVEPNMYEMMYARAKKEDFDVLECAYYKDWDNTRKVHKIRSYENSELKITPYNVWNKLYKAELLQESGLLFKKSIWYEDYDFNLKLAYFIKRPGILNIPLYHYYQRQNSIMHQINKKVFDDLLVLDDVDEFYKDKKTEIDFNDIGYVFAKSLLGSSLLRFIQYDVQNNTSYSSNNWKLLCKYCSTWKKSDLMKEKNKVNFYLSSFNRFTFSIYRKIFFLFFKLKNKRGVKNGKVQDK